MFFACLFDFCYIGYKSPKYINSNITVHHYCAPGQHIILHISYKDFRYIPGVMKTCNEKRRRAIISCKWPFSNTIISNSGHRSVYNHVLCFRLLHTR